MTGLMTEVVYAVKAVPMFADESEIVEAMMLADWRNELLEIVIEQGDDEELVELDQAFRKFDVVDMQELAQADYIAIDIKENELTIAEDDQAEFERMIARYEIDEFEHLFALEGINAW